jgi:hypothetical protein
MTGVVLLCLSQTHTPMDIAIAPLGWLSATTTNREKFVYIKTVALADT